MLFIQNDNTNPYFNLALEEYLLKDFGEDCFMLWQNASCVVVGKNQHILNEINQEYVKEHGLKVVRRLSGGGTVFHDLGNLNFTFIVNDANKNFLNYNKFTAPIVEVLAKLGVEAVLSKRNDLTIGGMKFSGNAQFKYKNRLLHHGTILFSASISDIKSALTVDTPEVSGRWVKSVSSEVTNVQNYLAQEITVEELKNMIQKQVASVQKIFSVYKLSLADIQKVNKLVQEKYSTMDWNYGNTQRNLNLMKI